MESLRQLYKIGSGPSSSHTMGPEYACLYVLKHYPQADFYKITLYGSLALTGKGHLTDQIIQKTLGQERTQIQFDYMTKQNHPNTMIMEIFHKGKSMDILLVESIGGGSILINRKPLDEWKEIYPFTSFKEIKQYCLKKQLSLADFVFLFEDETFSDYLQQVYETMVAAIQDGLCKQGELPGGLHVIRKAASLQQARQHPEPADVRELRIVSSYAFAVSEQNASGGTIVTAPTCGASGVLPAVLYYYEQKYHFRKQKIIEALAVAGIIGNIIKTNASISGAFAGCQSEVGSACSMAAAAVSYLSGQSMEEIEYAAEIALEHHLGLTCDPIKGLVQIPCIERNAVAALRAIDASKLSSFLKGTRKISFDTVVKTMYETGKDLNQNYKETSRGGLAKNYFH